MEITIRPYRAEDLDAVMELWLRGNLDAHPFVAPAYWEGNRAAVREQLPQAKVWVAAGADGAPIGFLGLTGGYIAGIFIAAAQRSQGIGRALLDEAKRRCPRLELHVYRQNRRALLFYLREGFAVTEARTDPETGAEELCMSWTCGTVPAEGGAAKAGRRETPV